MPKGVVGNAARKVGAIIVVNIIFIDGMKKVIRGSKGVGGEIGIGIWDDRGKWVFGRRLGSRGWGNVRGWDGCVIGGVGGIGNGCIICGVGGIRGGVGMEVWLRVGMGSRIIEGGVGGNIMGGHGGMGSSEVGDMRVGLLYLLFF